MKYGWGIAISIIFGLAVTAIVVGAQLMPEPELFSAVVIDKTIVGYGMVTKEVCVLEVIQEIRSLATNNGCMYAIGEDVVVIHDKHNFFIVGIGK